MFLLTLFLFGGLFFLNVLLSGTPLRTFFDWNAVVFVLFCGVVHYFLWGKKHFEPGIATVFRRPKRIEPEVASYFRHLTVYMLSVGILGLCIGLLWGILRPNPDIIGISIAFGLLSFFYASGLALLLYWPISLRHSGESAKSASFRNFPISMSLLGLAVFFLTRAFMVLILVAMSSVATVPPESEKIGRLTAGEIGMIFQRSLFYWNPVDLFGSFSFFPLRAHFDLPSLLSLMLSLLLFRRASGKIANRLVWVPVCILFGVWWSMFGFIIMLGNMDPDTFAVGCSVSLLSSFYGFLAALGFASGSMGKIGLRLFLLSILGLFLAAGAMMIPQMSGVDGPSIEKTVFFTVYGGALLVFLYVIFDGIRAFLFRSREKEETISPLDEEAKLMLDSAVKQAKSEK